MYFYIVILFKEVFKALMVKAYRKKVMIKPSDLIIAKKKVSSP